MYAKSLVCVTLRFFVGELILGIWLQFKGVDSERWYKLARISIS
jgi:hypothetical protein